MTDYEIVEAMIQYGGGFAHQFGILYRCADDSNQARLREAFPDLWNNYRDITEARAKSKAEVR